MTINIDEMSVDDLRRAEDGAAILHALADLLENKGAVTYAAQVRHDARAIQLLTQEHPSAGDIGRTAAFGVPEHRSEIAHRLSRSASV
ncbi:hypothetical protein [Cryobacterium sp. TMT2-23]|uniref:hypothetical protein n=1 Tax=Cryobacterium sp. TMT2-23 TaxID=1259252 RepID=UPI001069A1A2|nr:hypothetical protein [Cryobacterium sp. TMT2-23]TFD19986.1 hypothetical protein E3T32_09360 [Cryobacterium sp. TMT2-23]